MRKLDAIQAMLLAATANAALTNIEKHKVEKDYVIDLDLTGENALGKPAVTLTMNLKSLRYVTELLTSGRIAVDVADAQKRKPFHD
nr:MAG TPA: hypothetical protein [Caudoviricetes sp.]